jgi:predicted RNA binding protein YcfA (HicA-like mRNA interferase family)
MSKQDKRIEKMRQNPKNVRYNDLTNVLENIGFRMIGQAGSHVKFRYQMADRVWIHVVPKPHGKFV